MQVYILAIWQSIMLRAEQTTVAATTQCTIYQQKLNGSTIKQTFEIAVKGKSRPLSASRNNVLIFFPSLTILLCLASALGIPLPSFFPAPVAAQRAIK